MNQDYLNFISEALAGAAEIVKVHVGRAIWVKKAGDDNQIVTEADFAVGRFLIERIRKVYPRDNILDEEVGIVEAGSGNTWVIDPIDGTSNFAQGIPLYGIMIGLVEGETAIAGGIALPAFDNICVAQRGRGSWCNGEGLSVTTEPDLRSSLIAYGIDSHREEPDFTRRECAVVAEIVLGCRNIRSSNSAFDAVMVAAGRYGAVLNRSSRIWDNVAQHVLIEEAGGLYTDFGGKAMDYSRPLTKMDVNYTFCGASRALHSQLQEIIRRAEGDQDPAFLSNQ